MNEAFIAPAATLITSVVGAFVGALLSSKFGYQQAARQERDRRRREMAEVTISPLVELRRMLRHAEFERDERLWVEAVSAAYEALEDARHLLPSGLKHLRRSIQFALGEALGGIAVADSRPAMVSFGLSPFNERWTNYAEEFVGLAIDRIRAWRDASFAHERAVSLNTYDGWLASTGRYEFGKIA